MSETIQVGQRFECIESVAQKGATYVVLEARRGGWQCRRDDRGGGYETLLTTLPDARWWRLLPPQEVGPAKLCGRAWDGGSHPCTQKADHAGACSNLDPVAPGAVYVYAGKPSLPLKAVQPPAPPQPAPVPICHKCGTDGLFPERITKETRGRFCDPCYLSAEAAIPNTKAPPPSQPPRWWQPPEVGCRWQRRTR